MKLIDSFVLALSFSTILSAHAEVKVGDSVTYRAHASRGDQVLNYDRTAEIVWINAATDTVQLKNTFRLDDGRTHEEFITGKLSLLQNAERAVETVLSNCTPKAGRLFDARGTAQFEVLQTAAGAFDTCHFVGHLISTGENTDIHAGRVPIFQIVRIQRYDATVGATVTEVLKGFRKN